MSQKCIQSNRLPMNVGSRMFNFGNLTLSLFFIAEPLAEA